MTPTETEQMRADMAAGTPGPWISDAVFSYTGHATRVAFPDRYGVPGESIADCYQNWRDADITDQRISWKQAEVNACRIARLPTLETAYLAQAEEIARLREALKLLMDETYVPEPNCSCHISPPCSDCVNNGAVRDAMHYARAALGETK